MSRPRRLRRLCWRRDDGSASLEMVVLAPAFLALIALLTLFGRVALTHEQIDQAAITAARAASLARTPADARAAAGAAASGTLTAQRVTCPITTTLDTSGFSRPVGQPAHVQATVTCILPIADLGLPGTGASLTITATRTSPLDTYRERGR